DDWVPAPDAASAAHRQAVGRDDPSDHPGPSRRRQVEEAVLRIPELGWIIEMAAYDVSVNVVFLGGADFESPPPLGTTDRTRYIKVTSLEEAQRPELQKWIEQAGRTPGWT